MIQRLQKKRNEKGFTLIELLIVIIVLGILAAIVVFAVGSTRKDAVASSCKTDYTSVELSAEAVSTKMGGYPATADHGTALLGTTGSTLGGLLKIYPTNGDYTLTYKDNGTVAKTVGTTNYYTGYTLEVFNKATPPANLGSTVASCSGL